VYLIKNTFVISTKNISSVRVFLIWKNRFCMNELENRYYQSKESAEKCSGGEGGNGKKTKK